MTLLQQLIVADLKSLGLNYIEYSSIRSFQSSFDENSFTIKDRDNYLAVFIRLKDRAIPVKYELYNKTGYKTELKFSVEMILQGKCKDRGNGWRWNFYGNPLKKELYLDFTTEVPLHTLLENVEEFDEMGCFLRLKKFYDFI